jgi:beta-1,4-mannosyl-glycoprotein beta-1,4-N-acetylglucosaminyltransferase
MKIDVVTYNGESELLELRHEILKDYIDEFIVVQAPTTFTGKDKPIYEVPDWATSYVIDENYTKEEIDLAYTSPNTLGADHWKHEFLQKESIKKALTHLKDNDLVYVGDVDEIYEPYKGKLPAKLRLRVYTYWLNNRSSEIFWGTTVAKYKDIKNECLNHLRSNAPKTDEYYGWHFTSMYDMKKKLTDQYTADSYANKWVMDNLDQNVNEIKDFLGRNFKYSLDISDWPVYIKDNRNKYEHLCKS